MTELSSISSRKMTKGKKKRQIKRTGSGPITTLISSFTFKALGGLLIIGLIVQFLVVLHHDDIISIGRVGGEGGLRRTQEDLDKEQFYDENNVLLQPKRRNTNKNNNNNNKNDNNNAGIVSINDAHQSPHLYPKIPLLPPFAPIDNSDKLIDDLYKGRPTIAGIVAMFDIFLKELGDSFNEIRSAGLKGELHAPIDGYFNLAKKHLLPFDEKYRNKSIFPIRKDESVFISLAAFRDYLLDKTLEEAFTKAKNPDKLFIGAVVQNCFGLDYQCRTGVEVVGKDKFGHPKTKISDAPPDKNGIEAFCSNPTYKKYCDSGQVRVIYVHEGQALGPAYARYIASKLWGGEQYFVQVDAHLQFATDWDERYINELKATKNYPLSVLSAYPPGFQQADQMGKTPGPKLCHCEFSTADVEHKIIRINVHGKYSSVDEPTPKQIAYIAAGFFFTSSEFLTLVPFDPLMPWCFMGEEIALSMRAWTAGFDIYAPRINLIAHQYRPGRMGLPKFWESVGRALGRSGVNTPLQKIVIQRTKHMLGYPEITKEFVESNGDGIVLMDIEHYAMGTVRTREEYLKLTDIDMAEKKCHKIDWCINGDLE